MIGALRHHRGRVAWAKCIDPLVSGLGTGAALMAKTRGTGLLMAWMDVDPTYEDEFNRWYNEEHIGRLLEVPGFLSAGRYAALRGGPKYLAMYELEDHNVLRSAAFLDAVRYQPS